MRILLANKFFHHNAGAETAFFETRRLLLEDGHQVIDFAMAGDRNTASPYDEFFAPERTYDQDAPSWRRARDASASIYSLSARRAVRRLLIAHRPDVAHLHNIYHQLTLSIIDELALRGIPSVMTLHDYKIVCPSYNLYTNGQVCHRCVRGSVANAILHTCIKGSPAASMVGAIESSLARRRRSYDQLDAIISPSDFLGELARTRVAPEKVHILRNFLSGDREPSNALAETRSRPYVLYAGRLEEVKGVRLLGPAMGAVSADVDLVIVGDGPLEAELREVAARQRNVGFLGRMTRGRVAALMQGAVALLVPSVWEENCPMIVLEARQAGTPVICSDRGGLAELVDDGVDGVHINVSSPLPLAQAIDRLADDPDLRARMAERGSERLRRDHSPEAHLKGLLSIYRTAIRRKAPPPGRAKLPLSC